MVVILAGIALLIWGFMAASRPRWPALDDRLSPEEPEDSTEKQTCRTGSDSLRGRTMS
ncbi:MAG: hypothetical protein JW882_20985 [Deltaproteobacteria bacterium]|nr:hypothetical protein [Deltaproteobacteria bacterium]